MSLSAGRFAAIGSKPINRLVPGQRQRRREGRDLDEARQHERDLTRLSQQHARRAEPASRHAPATTYQTHLQVGGVSVPMVVNPRCDGCDKLLAHYLTAPFALECPRCGRLKQSGTTSAPATITVLSDSTAPLTAKPV